VRRGEENTYVVLMSDHGMGPVYRFIYLNNWLVNNGYMRFHSGITSRLKQLAFRAGITPINIYNLMVGLGVARMRTVVDYGPRERLLSRLFLSLADVDWARTVAYSVGNIGQISLNVRGREPQGIVSRGAEYDSVREGIINKLRVLVDPHSGDTIRNHIYRREEIYSGPYLDEAPDILVLPERLESQAAGTSAFLHNQLVGLPRGNSGGHRMNGVWLLRGPGIKTGFRVDNVRIVDLAPTLLHLLDVAIPQDMDGKVVFDAFEADSVLARPELREGTSWVGRAGTRGLSNEDRQEILDRLAGLGYVN
jgi:predicted AlkP superfamily phosphohydrolase/phosphomutase